MIIKISNINLEEDMCIQFNRCVKYRRKVLIDDIEKTLKESLLKFLMKII